MGDVIRIQMMGNFLIYINEQRVENPVSKSRKGTALVEYLVLHRGKPVPNQQLLRALWPEHSVTNPENALKTLVSRMRTLLNQMSQGLGSCIVSDRGAYHWQSLPEMHIDAMELMDLYDAIEAERDPDKLRTMYERVLELYTGDLFQTGDLEGDSGFAQQLHAQYLTAVYGYIELLRKAEDYNDIIAVCRTALEVDSFDDRLHIELMKAMVSLNRTSDALVQYKHATNLTYRYLGAPPSPEMMAFYQEMNRARQSLKYNLDAIRRELHNSSMERGAFVCDYELRLRLRDVQGHLQPGDAQPGAPGHHDVPGHHHGRRRRRRQRQHPPGQHHERPDRDPARQPAQGRHHHPFQPQRDRAAAAHRELQDRQHGDGAHSPAVLPALSQQRYPVPFPPGHARQGCLQGGGRGEQAGRIEQGASGIPEPGFRDSGSAFIWPITESLGNKRYV